MKPYTLITGGAGFIGSNLAHRLLREGRTVLIFDNLSRPGVETNLNQLSAEHADLRVVVEDVRNAAALKRAVRNADQVFHFAAQVAVTTSIDNPVEDFDINVRGTLNLLEAVRSVDRPPSLVFTSTNKVYGGLEDIQLHLNGSRYEPADQALRGGVSEKRPLDFHSPYGCSKGSADQYVIDYARTFRLPAAVFRMSCIYGPRQFGTEDQGWVAHFAIRGMQGQPITLYGDGLQVRDLLFVEDLLDAFLLAQQHMHEVAGQAFNIGGGPANTISVLELVKMVAARFGHKPSLSYAPWRQGDQRYYVSDTAKFRQATGWSPKVSVNDGVEKMITWLEQRPTTLRTHTAAAEDPLAILTPQS